MTIIDLICNDFVKHFGCTPSKAQTISQLLANSYPVLNDPKYSEGSLNTVETPGRARRNICFFEVSLADSVVRFIAKTPHHFTEPDRASKAAQLKLGPMVFFKDDTIIVEDWYPDDSKWDVAVDRLTEEPTAVGRHLLSQYMRMLANDSVHAFDALNDHIYVMGTPVEPEVRWIDWGRPRYLKSESATEPGWQIVSHFSALVGLLLNLRIGPEIFRGMVGGSSTITPEYSTVFIKNLLYQTKESLLNDDSFAGRILLPKWQAFFSHSV